MGNIIIEVEGLRCQDPIVKDTFRFSGGYKFNWSSVWDDYISSGIDATIDLWYSWDGGNQNIHYSGTALPLPGNADMYIIPYSTTPGDGNLPGHDQMNFRLVFTVNETCSYSYNILYENIINT